MSKSTRATKALEQAGKIGMQAAEALASRRSAC